MSIFNIFKKREPKLERKGYLLVVTYEPKEHGTVNYVFDREAKKFVKKKILAANTIMTESFYSDITEMIDEINGCRDYKRFLAGNNVSGIFYVETKVELSGDTYVSRTTSISFFYVPSKLKLELTSNSENRDKNKKEMRT